MVLHDWLCAEWLLLGLHMPVLWTALVRDSRCRLIAMIDKCGLQYGLACLLDETHAARPLGQDLHFFFRALTPTSVNAKQPRGT